MADDASTTTDAGSRKTALRRKPLQAVIAAALAEGPPTLTQNELRNEFGSALRVLWEEGYTAEAVSQRYIAQDDGATARRKKQIRAEIRQLWSEFENGTWRPAAAGNGARGGQSSQKADQTDTQEHGQAEHQKQAPVEAKMDEARAYAAHENGEQATSAEGNGDDADEAPDDPAPTDNEDGARSPEPDLADTVGEEEEGPPNDKEDAETLALRQDLEDAAHEARRTPGYGPER